MKTLTLAAMIALTLSQTGCIVMEISSGADSDNFSTGPLIVGAGSVIAAAALQTAIGTVAAGALGIGGVILDQKNPGRSDVLNTIPVTEKNASKYNVTQADIISYNDELPKVLQTHQKLKNIVMGLQNNHSPEEDLNQVAVSLGLKDGKSLEEAINSNKLSVENLQAFAISQGISESTAKIYLKSIGIKI